MTTEHQASRTLVKSPPELWAECSDASSLARHIGEFGEIRITRLEPESAIEWEGELAAGTVTIEPSGWGTRVTLTVQTGGEGAEELSAEEPSAEEPVAEEHVDEEPVAEKPAEENTDPVQEEADEKVEEAPAQPDLAVEADPAPAGGRWRRLIGRTRAWFRPADELEPPVDGPEASAGGPEASPEPSGAEATSIPPPSATLKRSPEPTLEPEPGPALERVPEATLEPEPEPAAGPEREPAAEPEPEQDSSPGDARDPEAILTAALDSLGQAHHRPFSRA